MWSIWLAGMMAATGGQCLSDPVAASLITLHPKGSRLTAVISPKLGGQLVGLQLRRDGRPVELLYRGMNFCPTSGFAGKAPILWPATGRTYLAGSAPDGSPIAGWNRFGTRYPMPIHGFAKDSAWRLIRIARSATSQSVSLRLEDSKATRALYPFRFVFTVTYRLEGRTLIVDHRIVAGPNPTPMPFSIGNHITFALPIGGRGTGAEATVSTPATAHMVLDAFGRPTARASQPPLDRVRLDSFGPEVAIPLAGYRGTGASATIEQPGSGTIVLSQSGSLVPDADPVRFNLWGNGPAGFFAAEPWLGLQNTLAAGKGVVELKPLRTFRWRLRLTFDL